MDRLSTAGLNAARSEDAEEDSEEEDDDEDLMSPDDGFEIEEDTDSDDEQE